MKKIYFVTSTILLVSVTLLTAFMFDRSTLPFGWEIPKVRFVQWWSILTIVLTTLMIYFTLAFRLIPRLFEQFQGSNSNKQTFSNLIKLKTENIPSHTKKYKYRIFVLLSLIFISIGSILSYYQARFESGARSFGNSFPEPNKLYESLRFIPNKQSYFGNIFREQGLITFLLILISLLLLTYIIKHLGTAEYRKLFVMILISILLAAFINSVEAIRQTSVYLIEDPSRLNEGKWIFGYFGQTNFFVGNQMLGILAGMQLFYMVNFTRLKSGKKIDNSYEIAIKTLLLISVFTIIISILPTFSTWGIGIAFGAVGLFMLQFLKLPKLKTSRQGYLSIRPASRTIRFPGRGKVGKTLNDNVDEDVVIFLKRLENLRFINIVNYLRSKLLSITYVHLCTLVLILCTLVLLPFMSLIRQYLPEQQHRINIWQGVYESYIVNPIENKEYELLFFGSGFDNLGEQLRSDNFLLQHYIDRAHNLPLDVLANTGIIGISLFAILIFSSYRRMWKYENMIVNCKLKNQKLMLCINNFLAIVLTVLLLRSLIHTNSIMNIVHIAIVLMLIWGISVKKEGGLE